MTNQPNELSYHMRIVAGHMKRRAAKLPWNGLMDSAGQKIIDMCRRLDRRTNTVLIFTRDYGHHTGGWFKNPDYERCLHLSISPAPSRLWTPLKRDLDDATRDAWIRAFFAPDERWLWHEGPQTPEGRSICVHHWRLFCDARWQPILPRGEVYSTELTERGWRSWSERLGPKEERDRGEPVPGSAAPADDPVARGRPGRDPALRRLEMSEPERRINVFEPDQTPPYDDPPRPRATEQQIIALGCSEHLVG